MASIETPPQIVPKEPRPHRNGSPRERKLITPDDTQLSEEEFHFLISELRDENSRSRMREAVWISIIVHMIILFVIKESPRLWPAAPVTVVSPAELINNQQLTYVDQRPDTQRVPKVESNKISDKNRMAMARNPQLKKLLDDLRDNRRTGAPGQQAQPQQAAQPAPQQQAPPQQQPQQQAQPPQQTQSAMNKPPEQNPFANYRGASASSAIQQAARAAAAGRGSSGEYGNGLADPNTPNQGALDILSDTQGVDFGPYLQRVLHDVKMNWYAIIPEEAKDPLFKQGKVAIEFVITPNGEIEGMALRLPSGDVALDRAAWGGIKGSNPFPPLPKEFHGPYLALRFHFYYNPPRGTELK
jgi:TonB family protein